MFGLSFAILQYLPLIMTLVQTAEAIGGSGPTKYAAVVEAVTKQIPDDVAPHVVPQLKAAVNGVVGIFNALHPLFAKASAPTTAPSTIVQAMGLPVAGLATRPPAVIPAAANAAMTLGLGDAMPPAARDD